MNQFSYTITPLGDSALLVFFGNTIDDTINQKVFSLFKKIKHSSLPVIDIVPAYSSLAVYYSTAIATKNKSAYESMKEKIENLLYQVVINKPIIGRQIRIPVCYESQYAPDLKNIAQQKNLSRNDIIDMHTSQAYRVYMIGFLPGFAYMGKVDSRIATARKNLPVPVVAGSVGIAGGQTGVYPLSSPGGWNIIGRTPITLFDKERTEPVYLQPGDEISFYAITENEFENY